MRDLLNPATKGNLKVREHPSTGPYVEDLAKLAVSSFEEIANLMDEGNKARTVAATNMNETSSRSHAVFTLMLTQKKYDVETKMEMEKVAKISLVDLAGSERATSTGATGARLKEGAEINRSLSTLGRVIAALADLSTGKKKKGAATAQVPYRDSVLTWLLKDSLGGNSMTAMIAAISPADINYEETLSTLRYADSAKRIKNHAVINEDANARMIRELKEELALLRSKLAGGTLAGPGGVSGPADEVYEEGTPLEKQFVTITAPDGSIKKVSKAEIAEQLHQSEKLLQDLNETWEQKLARTEAIHKEREAALEELGISIEKGFIGVSTPKKMPHLVNLSDDPLLAECLVYYLKPGITTVGNVDTNTDHQANIRLNGTRILHDHCIFENAPDGTVTITPCEGASVMINGKRITEKKQLHSGFRVILGDFHIFRFNHPMEARAERADRSLLRQSITTSQLHGIGLDRTSPSPSPSPRPGHERSYSKAASEVGDSRPESPAPFQRTGRDSDWSMARREAAGAILGNDQNLSSLTDEELNALFEDVQRARAERVNGREGEEDVDSVTSYPPVREKYLSTGTIDNFSLDTALTMPSTPKQGDAEDKLREAKEEMQSLLERQKEDFQEQLRNAEAANVEIEEIKAEKAKMEETLRQLKEDMQRELEKQRLQYEDKLEKLDPTRRFNHAGARKGKGKLSENEISLARKTVKHWRSRRYVRMAEAVLQHAATLKEAQVMSNELDEGVVFQFSVVDIGQAMCSSYDLVLNGLTAEGDDTALEDAQKPCIGVRVIDYKNAVVRLWSLEKLHDRVRQMRQMHQYLDQPEYARHLSIDDPFVEPCMPQYSLMGETDVPLRAVFESRVHDVTLDVLSPYTTQAIGIVKISLEPSHARAPSNTLKFNVVMHELVGFAEREGTDVHAQLFIPGVSEEEGGVTTTQMIRDFDEEPVRFESVHSMSLPLSAPQSLNLRVAIFARVSAMHLDKLISWDDMRDAAPVRIPPSNHDGQDRESQPQRPQQAKLTRIAETQFYTQEKHDLLARVQVLELSESGQYVPVEVTQTSELDDGTFQLHQGLQRRIAINVTHSSGDMLPWDDVTSMRIGRIQLIDHAGRAPDIASQPADVALRLASKPVFRNNANGTRSITMVGHWDSSLHNSLLLDRATADKYRVQMTVSWEIGSGRLAEPMRFSLPVSCRILPRGFVRQASVFTSLFSTTRIVQSACAIFTLTLRPAPIKAAGDLWRMSSHHDYVKGEENLAHWAPRGVSLVGDFIAARKRRARGVEVAAAQGFLRKILLPSCSVNGPILAQPALDGDKGGDSGETDSLPPRTIVINDDDVLNDPPDTPQIPLVQDEERGQGNRENIGERNEEEAQRQTTTEYENTHSPAQEALLRKYVDLWKKYPDPLNRILSPENTDPPPDGIAGEPPSLPRLISTIIRVPKNPKVLKSGYLLLPSSDATRWVKRFVELRRPFLHVYSVANGEEIAIVSLRNSRVDSQPGVLALLYGVHHDQNSSAATDDPSVPALGQDDWASRPQHRRTASGRVIASLWTGQLASGRSSAGFGFGFGDGDSASAGSPRMQRLSERLQAAVFAIYGTDNTWLFTARGERDKTDWIARIDQSFTTLSNGGSPGTSDR